METIELINHPVGYEYRVANGDYSWSDWGKVEPRNAFTDTLEDRVREIQAYINAGYRYQIRALYVGPIPAEILAPSNA